MGKDGEKAGDITQLQNICLANMTPYFKNLLKTLGKEIYIIITITFVIVVIDV